ncbi:EAL domain-containing protein [uncultured Desulfuromonas sp.]|uniref:bifunctional diguanylate cyclase/phosphodiesterase n=1 Tax=uncultured Desulfuromonas sp. TaxID=181013 RepID=UPI002602464A|nr:EAL domain-containing protein [uncultured Desulfuromonas sp.]
MLGILLVASMAGNIIPLSLFPEGTVYLGGVAVLLVVKQYGVRWGVAAALLSGMHTLALLHHPFFAILFVGEALVVGMILRRGSANLLLADLGYWLFFGLPLFWFFFSVILKVDPEATSRLMAIQGANGAANALIATGLLRLIDARRNVFPGLSLWEHYFNMILVCFLTPTVLVMALNLTAMTDALKPDLAQKLTIECNVVQAKLASLMSKATLAQTELAGVASKEGLRQTRLLQDKTDTFARNCPELADLCVLDPEGNPLARARSSSKTAGEAIRPNFLESLRSSPHPLLSGIQKLGPSSSPIVQLGTPIQRKSGFAGFVLGTIDMSPVTALLQDMSLPAGLSLTLLDDRNQVVSSSNANRRPVEPFFNQKRQTLNLLHYLWNPVEQKLVPLLPWQDLLTRRISVDRSVPWQLAVEVPQAIHQAHLERLYVHSMAIMAVPAGLAILLAWVASRRMVQPLRELARVSESLPERLRENQEITWPSGTISEVGTLVENFKSLAVDLKKSYDETHRTRENAEETIDGVKAQRNWEVFRTGRKLQNEMDRRQRIENLMAELETAESKYRFLIENTLVGVFIIHGDSFSYVNPRFAEIFGYSQEELLNGITPVDLVAREDKVFVSGNLRRLSLAEVRNLQYQFQGVRKEGRTINVEVLNGWGMYDGRGAILGTLMDISERKEAEETIKHLAYHDPLTDLPNRPLFRDHVEKALAFANRNGNVVGLMFVDLDNFKTINDTLGHDAGDMLLKEVSKRLLDCVRETDTVSRFGGDEFNILLAPIRHESDAGLVAHKILNSLQWPFKIAGHDLHVSCSIGIVIYPKDGEEVLTLIKNADVALYRAKDLGKNNYQFFAPAMNAGALERMELENGLRSALPHCELRVLYQPQVDLATGRVAGMEALVRWQHPSGDLIPPEVFIPLAEEIGLISDIGFWVMKTACSQAKAWQEAGGRPIRIGINVSAQQFQNDDFLDILNDILKELDFDPRWLDLEITESLVVKDVKQTDARLCDLRDMGVSVAIDDFGVGYSSLSYLKDFPVDLLKVDRSFVSNLPHNESEAKIARHIVEMAHSLNIRVIAEGVERTEQLDFLRSIGCDEVQGYIYSPPLPAESFSVNHMKDRQAPKREKGVLPSPAGLS